MSIVENYRQTCRTIERAAEKAGRDPSSVELLVVSKTWEASVVRPLIEAGHDVYGENRVQEAAEKIPQLPDHLEWHLIGHLQKNKIRKALGLFHTIHTIDSQETARRVERIAHETGHFPRVLLQVNLGEEAQKHGFMEGELSAVLGEVLTLPRLEVVGLMAIPPIADTPEATRPHFRHLRELRDRLEDAYSHPLPELSMGMTSDYPVAIEEGATIVRVGSAIFGSRHPRPD